MRKTKHPRHSRLIRKWDGTPLADSPPADDVPADAAEALAVPPRRSREELVFEFDVENELSDPLQR